MSHYDIRYDDDLEGAAKRGKAIQDIISYMGAERFAAISEILHKARANGEVLKHNDKDFRWAAMLNGVQGYPVRAWFELLFGEVQDDEDEQETRLERAQAEAAFPSLTGGEE